MIWLNWNSTILSSGTRSSRQISRYGSLLVARNFKNHTSYSTLFDAVDRRHNHFGQSEIDRRIGSQPKGDERPFVSLHQVFSAKVALFCTLERLTYRLFKHLHPLELETSLLGNGVLTWLCKFLNVWIRTLFLDRVP